jgi:nifR3 family TIM-barrel protein
VGSLRLASNLVFAPLSGISSWPARLIAREAGAGLVFTETVSAQGLLRERPEVLRKLETTDGEAPLAFQLFGADPDALGEACARLAERGAAWVDLNMGCPVPRFIRKGAGAALLRDPDRAARAVAAMRRRFPGVLSAKLRSGWDERSRNAPEVARRLVDAGVDALAVHGRTRAQQYRGRADRGVIRAVVDAVPGTPVFANGDVADARAADAMLADTGAAGVMIGRGAVGNPWIFRRAARPAGRGERLAVLERHLELLARACPDPERRLFQLRRYVAAYSKGLPGGVHFRREALAESDPERVVARARAFLAPRAEAA